MRSHDNNQGSRKCSDHQVGSKRRGRSQGKLGSHPQVRVQLQMSGSNVQTQAPLCHHCRWNSGGGQALELKLKSCSHGKESWPWLKPPSSSNLSKANKGKGAALSHATSKLGPSNSPTSPSRATTRPWSFQSSTPLVRGLSPCLTQHQAEELYKCRWHWQGHEEPVSHPSPQQRCILRG